MPCNYEVAIRQRRCHNCNSIIRPDEHHIKVYVSGWNTSPENICQACLSSMAKSIEDANKQEVTEHL